MAIVVGASAVFSYTARPAGPPYVGIGSPSWSSSGYPLLPRGESLRVRTCCCPGTSLQRSTGHRRRSRPTCSVGLELLSRRSLTRSARLRVTTWLSGHHFVRRGRPWPWPCLLQRVVFGNRSVLGCRSAWLLGSASTCPTRMCRGRLRSETDEGAASAGQWRWRPLRALGEVSGKRPGSLKPDQSSSLSLSWSSWSTCWLRTLPLAASMVTSWLLWSLPRTSTSQTVEPLRSLSSRP